MSSPGTPATVTPTPQQLRALTHPVRLRMLGLLRVEGPATATVLATRLGLNTGATSYHLRQLAQHGFVEDAPDLGTGRERWWRAAHRSTTTSDTPPADTADREALEAYLQSVVTVMSQQVQRAIEERQLLPPAWAAASTFSDWVVRLSPAGAQRLLDTLLEVLRESEAEARAAGVDGADGADDPDAEQYVVQLSAFPLPGHLGADRP